MGLVRKKRAIEMRVVGSSALLFSGTRGNHGNLMPGRSRCLFSPPLMQVLGMQLFMPETHCHKMEANSFLCKELQLLRLAGNSWQLLVVETWNARI